MERNEHQHISSKRWELWAAFALCCVAAIILVPFVRPVTDAVFSWVLSVLAGERGDAASILSDGSVLSQVYISFVLPSLAFLLALLVATLAVRVISDWIHRWCREDSRASEFRDAYTLTVGSSLMLVVKRGER